MKQQLEIIHFQERDLAILRELFESRIMTSSHWGNYLDTELPDSWFDNPQPLLYIIAGNLRRGQPFKLIAYFRENCAMVAPWADLPPAEKGR